MLCLYHCQAENHIKIITAAYQGNEQAYKIMNAIDQQGTPSTRKAGGMHCRFASNYTRFARKLDLAVPDFAREIYGHPFTKSKGRSAAQKRCTKAQLQQRNIELEAKVKSLQKELDECTSLMLQSQLELGVAEDTLSKVCLVSFCTSHCLRLGLLFVVF